jgi:hypothetical protein
LPAGLISVFDEEIEKLSDCLTFAERMPKGKIRADLVNISATISPAGNIAVVNELGDDSVRRALRNPHGRSDVAQPRGRVMSRRS